MQLILLSGVSGSGKSIALAVLEDAGYYCVDNLPAPLLPQLVAELRAEGYGHVAVAVDMRGGASIAALPKQLTDLQAVGDLEMRFVFLDARDDVLIQRFSETRRGHPLAIGDMTLGEAIRQERQALDTVSGLGHRIDTSNLRPNALGAFIRDFAALPGGSGLTLLFESFGFKHGLPLDADLVFDVRCLPNPHYDPAMRPLTGLDREVIEFLKADPEVGRMLDDIHRFVADWLPAYIRDNRSYLTVALGCTGGQHRSVYFAEVLAARFSSDITPASGYESPLKLCFRDGVRVLVRHRSLIP
jgi:UPF0042 nucleotide-binding protein